MKVIVTESKIGVEYIADVISSCDQNGIECIVDDNAGDILYYLPKEGKYGNDKLLQNSDESIFDLVKDKERLANVLMDAQGDKFKEFAVQWNDLQKKGEDEEVYKTQHCNPIRGNFSEKARNTRPTTEKDREEFERFRAKWKALGDKPNGLGGTGSGLSDDAKAHLERLKHTKDDFGMRVNGIEAQVSESEGRDLLLDTQVITDGNTAKVNLVCSKCGETSYVASMPMSVWKLGCRRVEQGLPFKKAFPSLYPAELERLEKWMCPSCAMGIDKSISESDDPRDWSASEGEVEIVWTTNQYEDFGIFEGDTSIYVIDYDLVEDREDLIDEVCRLIGQEYPDLDFDTDDFEITNEKEFWDNRSGGALSEEIYES